MHRYKFTIIFGAALGIFFVAAEVVSEATRPGLSMTMATGSPFRLFITKLSLDPYLVLSRWVLVPALGAGLCAMYGAAIGLFIDWLRRQR